jgi:hypothetical protein
MKMHRKFVHVRPSLGWKNSVLIHDNARPHVSRHTTEFMTSKLLETLPQPAYSPDYNLLDRWMFSLLEKERVLVNFDNEDNLREFLQTTLTGLPKSDFAIQRDRLVKDLYAIADKHGDYL